MSGRAVPTKETVAEGSGATLVVRPPGANPWGAGARVARREWLLCLEPGDIPAEGWIRSLDRFVGTARPDMALGRMRRAHSALPATRAPAPHGLAPGGRTTRVAPLPSATVSSAGQA
jgi:hypothetical protein